MPPSPPLTISLTRAQAIALAHVADRLGPQIHDLWPDDRSRAPAVGAIFAIQTAVEDGTTPDPFETDIEHFVSTIGDIRSAEFATVIRSRMTDLMAVAALWRAVEDLSPDAEADGLLDVEAVDTLDWRAEVLDLLIDRGVEIILPGEGTR